MRHGSYELPDGRSVVFADAEERQVDKIWALQRAVLAEGMWFLRHPDEIRDPHEHVSQAIARLSADEGSLFLVARCKAEVVGVLTLSRPELRRLSHLAHLEVYVAEDYRAQGLGQALVRCGLTWAVSSRALQKVSLAVFAHNERAIALYHRLGFEEEGRRRGEVLSDDGALLDDVLMARRV